MKISVSLPGEVVVFLDEYALHHQVPSRSAVLQRAVELLRADQLGESYEAAFTEWDDDAWGATVGDGLVDAER